MLDRRYWIAAVVFLIVVPDVNLFAQEPPQFPRPTPGALRRASAPAAPRQPRRLPLPATPTARANEAAIEVQPTARGFAMRGQRYSAELSTTGWSYRRQGRHAGQDAVLDYELERISAGPTAIYERSGATIAALQQVSPTAFAFTRAPGVVEIYRPNSRGLEQLFQFATRPAPGDLRIVGRVRTPLQGRYEERFGIVFSETISANRRADRLVYSHPVAIDAAGRRFRGAVAIDGDRLSIAFTASQLDRMQFPITIDPVVGDGIEIAAPASAPAAVFSAAHEEYAIVYEEGVEEEGNPIVVQRRDRDGNWLGEVVVSEIPGRDPDIAYSERDDRYAVVFAVRGPNICAGGESFLVLVILDGECQPTDSFAVSGPGDMRCYREPKVFTHPDPPDDSFNPFTIVWADSSGSERRIMAERVWTDGQPYEWYDDVVLVEESSSDDNHDLALAYAPELDRFCLTYSEPALIAMVVDANLGVIHNQVGLAGEESSVTWDYTHFQVVSADGPCSPPDYDRDVVLMTLDGDGALQSASAIVAGDPDAADPAIHYSPVAGEMLVVWLEFPFGDWDPDERRELMYNEGIPFCEEWPYDYNPRVIAQAFSPSGQPNGSPFELHWDAPGYYPDDDGWRSEAAMPTLAKGAEPERFLPIWQESKWVRCWYDEGGPTGPVVEERLALLARLVEPEAANHPPVADSTWASTSEDVAVEFWITGADVDNDTLDFQIILTPAHGAVLPVTWAPQARRYRYTPAANYHGPDMFTFRAFDGALYSNVASVSISIAPVNDPPVALPQSVVTSENRPVAIQLTGTDVDGNPVTYSINSQPAHGALSGTPPSISYQPASQYIGPDQFTFVANDGTTNSAPATVSVAVKRYNAFTIGWAHAGWPSGTVNVLADGLTINVPVTPPASGGQIAHAVAAACVGSGLTAWATGNVVIVLTTAGPATILTDIPGLILNPVGDAPQGLSTEQVSCPPQRGEEFLTRDPWVPTPIYEGEPYLPGWAFTIKDTTTPQARQQGGSPPPWECQEPYRGDVQIGLGVFAHSGELAYQKSYLHVAGVGMDFEFMLTYRSQSPISSSDVGPGWSHNWDRKLTFTEDMEWAALSNGYGRADTLWYDASLGAHLDGRGQFKTVAWIYPWAYVTDRYGTVERYHVPSKLLDYVEDRNGNRITVHYTQNCNVASVTDTLGRSISYEHATIPIPGRNGSTDYEERLVAVVDHTGRRVSLTYASGGFSTFNQGDLISITSPAGNTTGFTYDVRQSAPGSPDPLLDALHHNLLTVTEPGDTVPLQITYGDQGGFAHDRVLGQTLGTRHWGFGYVGTDGCHSVTTTETDPNSNTKSFFINAQGQLEWETALTRGVRPTGTEEGLENAVQDLAAYTTTYSRNIDGLILTQWNPDGMTIVNAYQVLLSPPVGDARLIRGNLLSRTVDPHDSAPPIIEAWTYDGAFVHTHTSPRGFVTTSTLDNRKNITRIDYPGQPTSYETFTYNSRGQVLEHRRAEGNIDVTEYENGFPRRVKRDFQHEVGANSGSPAAPAAVVTEYLRDALGRVVTEIDGRGVMSFTEWTVEDQISRVSAAAALAPGAEPGLVPLTTLETLTFYDAKNRVVQINRRLDNPDTPDHDSPATPHPDAGYLSTSFVYDLVGNRLEERSEVRPGVVQTVRRQYDGNNNIIRVESAEAVAGNQPGNVVETTYDEFDRPYVITEAPNTADERTTVFDYYFDSGSASYQIDGRGFATRTVHDGFGRPVIVVDALDGERHSVYDASNNVVETRAFGDPGPIAPDETPSGGSGSVLLSEETTQFDERERPIRRAVRLFRAEQPLSGEPETPILTDGDGDGWAEALTTYDREGRVVAVTNDNGHVASSVCDGLGRPIVASDAEGNSVETTYDANGNPTLIRSLEFDQLLAITETFDTQKAYDAADRNISTTDNAGNVATTAYDSLGLVRETTDREGNRVRHFYDGLSRSIRTDWVLTASGVGPDVPDPSQGGGDGLITEAIEYDLNGRISGRIDDNQNPTIFEYSNRSLLIRETHADGSFASYTHDLNGNVVERFDFNGTLISQDFDTLNRLTGVAATPASGNPHNVAGTLAQTFGYDGLSRMVVASDDNFSAGDLSEVHYTYDSLSRVLSDKQIFARGNPLYYGERVNAEFDGIGNLTRLTYPGGLEIERAHDGIERLTDVRTDTGESLATYKFAGPSRVRLRQPGETGGMLVDYDSLQRPVRLIHDSIAEFEYGYDRVGNRLFEHPTHDPDHGRAHRYDSAYRVLSTDEGQVDPLSASVPNPIDDDRFTYDGVGNRLERQRIGTGATVYSVNELNQYSEVDGVNFSYDLNGNLVSDGQFDYAYDFQNRLRLISNAGGGAVIARYLYDGRGRRIAKEVTNSGHDGEWTFLFHESRVIEDRRTAPMELLASYVYGIQIDEVLARIEPGSTHYYHPDVLGSVVALTQGGGQVVERYRYETYGAATFLDEGFAELSESAVGNRVLFTGRELEPESGLYFYRARYYSPVLGRFLSRDPAGFVDGLNLYAYVQGNPTNRTDPTGLNDEGATDDGPAGPGMTSEREKTNRERLIDATEREIADLDKEIATIEKEIDDSWNPLAGNFIGGGRLQALKNARRHQLEELESLRKSLRETNDKRARDAAYELKKGAVVIMVMGTTAVVGGEAGRRLQRAVESYIAKNAQAGAKETVARILTEAGVRPPPAAQSAGQPPTTAAASQPPAAGAAIQPSGKGPDFIVTPMGQAVPVPTGAAGPTPTRAPGFQFQGGSGGKGLDPRVTGVRVMDASNTQGPRAVYMNETGQTVNPATGRTVSNSDPAAHHYLFPWLP